MYVKNRPEWVLANFLTYAGQTWAFNNKTVAKIKTCQSALE